MNKSFLTDCIGYNALRFLGPLFRAMPVGVGLFFGRRIADLVCLLDYKHRVIVHANIRQALGDRLFPCALARISREFYRSYGQNLIEMFFIPRVDKEYLKKYISFTGRQNIEVGFSRGKGVLFLSVHAGSWELSGIICANLGVPFNLLVREQRYPRLEQLLNSYRGKKGCRFIQRQYQLRRIIEVLRQNESIGLSLDQGGKSGMRVDFFGKEASMATGAIKLALKYDATIVPVFFRRQRGPYIEAIIAPPYIVKRSGDEQKDTQGNLQALVRIFEGLIRQYPAEYLWTYKAWKYGLSRKVVVLTDGKAGHLRQAQAAAACVQRVLAKKGIKAQCEPIEVRFKNGLAKFAFGLAALLSGRYNCQGCLWCFRKFLKPGCSELLVHTNADMVISCGSSLACVASVLAQENNAKAISVMRPGVLGPGRFTALIVPRHDSPPKARNIAVSEGALNLIDRRYLAEESKALLESLGCLLEPGDLNIGLLLGGDTKHFRLSLESVKTVLGQVKDAAEKLNAFILVATSRRTPKEAEALIKKELAGHARCKLLIIANENNSPHAVGGILGLSRLVVVSPESISMVSEAASSGDYTVVFDGRMDRRHGLFLKNLADRKHIYLTKCLGLSSLAQELLLKRPEVTPLCDRAKVEDFLAKIL